jgi:hypothetical protein
VAILIVVGAVLFWLLGGVLLSWCAVKSGELSLDDDDVWAELAMLCIFSWSIILIFGPPALVMFVTGKAMHRLMRWLT